jgi:putative ABC transport system ATP-binding protein
MSKLPADDTGSLEIGPIESAGIARAARATRPEGAFVRVENLIKTYRRRGREIRALEIDEFTIERGEFVGVRGPSGSGKSTLLFILGAMLRPDRGRVVIGDIAIDALGSAARDRWRAETIGFVFQSFHLFPYLGVLENVLLAARRTSSAVDARAREILERLGLEERLEHRPGELSAGESQRTALARALLSEPSLLLADEPTGNLDSESSARLFGLLEEYRSRGGTVLVVSHGPEIERFADRVVDSSAGRLFASR